MTLDAWGPVTIHTGDILPLPMSGGFVEVLEIGVCGRDECQCRTAADAGVTPIHYRELPEHEVP